MGRPQDLLPFLQPIRPALVLTFLTLLAFIFSSNKQQISTVFSLSETKRYLLFYGIMIIGIPFAYHRGVAFEYVFTKYLPNILYFIILVAEINSLDKLKSLIWVICLLTFTYSFFGGIIFGGTSRTGRFELYGSMFDPNDTAYLLLTLFPLCLFYLLFDQGITKKIIGIVAIFSSIAVILLTGSRGGFLGLAAVLAILLFTRIVDINKSNKVFLILLMGAGYFFMADKIDIERFLSLTDVSSDYNMTEEGGRIAIWEGGLRMALAHPLTGVGVECYPFALYLDREGVNASYLGWQHTHNSFLQIAAEMGLIGFFIFILLILQTLITFLRASKITVKKGEACEIKVLAGLMLLGFVGQLVSGFFLTHGYSNYFTLYFALGAVIRRLQVELELGKASPLSQSTKVLLMGAAK